jgi:hypothetical protein
MAHSAHVDLPAACPYCDSDDVTFSFIPGDDVVGSGNLVFSCGHCGSHVESPISYFEPPAGDPRYVPHLVPAQRPEADPDFRDRERRPTWTRSEAV